MSIKDTRTAACDKCGAIINPNDIPFRQSLKQKMKTSTVPYPKNTIACSAACSAAILSANATALLLEPVPSPAPAPNT